MKFNYTLNETLTNFFNNYRSQEFIEDLVSIGIDMTEIFLDDIRSGSIIISGFIPSVSESNANRIQNLLSTSSLPRFSILDFVSAIVSSQGNQNPGPTPTINP